MTVEILVCVVLLGTKHLQLSHEWCFKPLFSHVFSGTVMVKTYVKGFKIDRKNVADVADVESDRDAEVDAYIRVILSGLDRSGYKFIAAAQEHIPPGQKPDGRSIDHCSRGRVR